MTRVEVSPLNNCSTLSKLSDLRLKQEKSCKLSMPTLINKKWILKHSYQSSGSVPTTTARNLYDSYLKFSTSKEKEPLELSNSQLSVRAWERDFPWLKSSR